MEKVDFDLGMSCRLLHPRHTVLISCANKEGKTDIVTVAWSMPVSYVPPLVAASLRPTHCSTKMIEETGEFVVNVPSMDFVKETLLCGRVSGRNHDKFKESKLTPGVSKKVKAPIINECFAHLECKVVNKIPAGDHIIVVGEVLAAYTTKGAFSPNCNIAKFKPVFHVGDDDFAELSPEIRSIHISR